VACGIYRVPRAAGPIQPPGELTEGRTCLEEGCLRGR
jgi:hypothetical protein